MSVVELQNLSSKPLDVVPRLSIRKEVQQKAHIVGLRNISLLALGSSVLFGSMAFIGICTAPLLIVTLLTMSVLAVSGSLYQNVSAKNAVEQHRFMNNLYAYLDDCSVDNKNDS